MPENTLPYTIHREKDGPQTVTATSPVPGLYVYELPADLDPASPCRWRLGHHSGLAIAAALYEDDAVHGAHRIADLTDWTKTADELRNQVDIEETYDRLAWSCCEHPSWV